jgi:glycosyltransferase involved in cell wall biosynthesis
LEAAVMGRPVVASRVGGLPEVVAQGRTGLLVAAGDAAELAAASVALLADPVRMAEMGRTARRRAETLFAWDRYVNTYDALYATLAVARLAAIRMPGPEGGPAISPKAGAGA